MSRIKIIHTLDTLDTLDNNPIEKKIKKECDICYEKTSEKKFKKFECTHELCDQCYEKLPNEKCPFCRQIIQEKINEPIEVFKEPAV